MSTYKITEDVIDSREIIERLEEMEIEYGPDPELPPNPETGEQDTRDTIRTWDMDDDEREEYAALCALREQAEDDCADWAYGETFIHEDYFTEYAMEMLEECGYLPADMPPWIIIDRYATARNMLMDYTPYEVNGVTYYAR